jgi:hypothetical protein
VQDILGLRCGIEVAGELLAVVREHTSNGQLAEHPSSSQAQKNIVDELLKDADPETVVSCEGLLDERSRRPWPRGF